MKGLKLIMQEHIESNLEIDNFYEENLLDSYNDMIKQHKRYLTNEIFKSIFKITNKIDKNQIERLIDKYLSLELEYTGIYTINNLTEKLNQTSKSISNQISNDFNKKDELFKTYIEEIKSILKKNQMDWISNITEDFVKVFINELKNNLEDNQNLNNDQITRITKNITEPINIVFKKYENKFQNEYQNILKIYIENKLTQMKEKINSIEKENQTKKNIEQFYPLINLSNYELINEPNHIYIKDKETKQQYELFYHDNCLKTEDNQIKFNINQEEKHQGYINNIKNKRIVVHNGFITLVLLNNNQSNKTVNKKVISFRKINHQYQFYYNSKKVNDIDKIEVLLNVIKINAPEIYHKITNDKDYINIQKLIDKRKRDKLIDDLINNIMNENYELTKKSSSNNNHRKRK